MNRSIVPAILSPSLGDIKGKLLSLKGFAREVQIDVVDGVLAPLKTWPYTDEESFAKILREEETLPYWEDFSFEFDCMVKNPKQEVERFVMAGAERVVVHAEAFASPMDCSEFLSSFKAKYSSGSLLDVLAGIAFKPDAIVDDFSDAIKEAHFVQVMGILNIGRQGQRFDERTFSLVEKIRSIAPEKDISVDGGVSLDNASALFESGANRLVVGSAIFNSENISETIEEFRSLI